MAGPWLVDTGMLLKMDNDQLVMLAPEPVVKWSIEMGNDLLAGAPQNVGTQILLTFRSGKLVVVKPTTGQVINQYELGQPIIHQPLREGQLMYICGLDGTVHVADLTALAGTN